MSQDDANGRRSPQGGRLIWRGRMQPTVEDIELLKRIYANGQSVHADSNVDHRPYKRLQDIGWLTSTALALPNVVYKLTSSGLKRALQELRSE